jgi:hypothetical protein
MLERLLTKFNCILGGITLGTGHPLFPSCLPRLVKASDS